MSAVPGVPARPRKINRQVQADPLPPWSRRSGRPQGFYEVEFADDEGRAYAMVALRADSGDAVALRTEGRGCLSDPWRREWHVGRRYVVGKIIHQVQSDPVRSPEERTGTA